MDGCKLHFVSLFLWHVQWQSWILFYSKMQLCRRRRRTGAMRRISWSSTCWNGQLWSADSLHVRAVTVKFSVLQQGERVSALILVWGLVNGLEVGEPWPGSVAAAVSLSSPEFVVSCCYKTESCTSWREASCGMTSACWLSANYTQAELACVTSSLILYYCSTPDSRGWVSLNRW